MTFLLYLFLGAFAGTLAGLFGIGGGLIIVPALIFSFQLQGLPTQVLTHLALGTSLATIVVTSASSLRAHHSKGSVEWSLFLLLGSGILVGAWLGVYTATKMSGEVLQQLIGAFALLISVKMWCGFKVRKGTRIQSKVLWVASGTSIGWLSSLFGIGGGTVMVPYLRWSNICMTKAVGTSAACGLPIALTGAVANMVLGQNNALLPTLSTGYVYWPAFFGIVITSALFARFGASLAHRIPEERLQKSFALFLLLVGSQFLLPV